MSKSMDEKFEKWWKTDGCKYFDTKDACLSYASQLTAQHAEELRLANDRAEASNESVLDENERLMNQLAATQAAALEMAAAAADDEGYIHRGELRFLIPPDSATALSRALDEAQQEAYKQATLECFKRERWENNGTMPWNAATNGERERNGHEIADAIRALIPGAPQSTQHESIEATEEEFDIWLSLKTRVFELERELAARDARALTRALDEARREGLQQAIWIAGGTPFRCHADDDVNFHSAGCVQTRDRIIAAIRHYIALPLTPAAPEGEK